MSEPVYDATALKESVRDARVRVQELSLEKKEIVDEMVSFEARAAALRIQLDNVAADDEIRLLGDDVGDVDRELL